MMLTTYYIFLYQQLSIAHPLVDLQTPFMHFLAIEYALAMSSTAVAVLLGCAVEDPTMATEFLPLLFVPQLLFAGFFVRTDLIPPCESTHAFCNSKLLIKTNILFRVAMGSILVCADLRRPTCAFGGIW